MDAILNCKPEDLEDYYNLLGCDELSTVEQILAEYKIKALECHPDKHPGNPKAVEDFQRLQQAKETLTNAERRARYDHWRRSRVPVPFRHWEALSSSVRTVRAAGMSYSSAFCRVPGSGRGHVNALGCPKRKAVERDCWKGAGNKKMLQSLMCNHSLQRIQTPQDFQRGITGTCVSAGQAMLHQTF
uniref:dnaJ homolog subfamily C member 12 isoform X3 n=1 Tax=Agelaius phoeniceus TaxID=39638 RepID=UPI0023EC349E|nr:dnaJ homolog subfamily C member 12 isoform X3 [Agelaius phoeniceus]